MTEELLSPAVEDYLEAIFNLEKDKKAVRVKDIAQKMMVKLPTVTSMLNTLLQKGLIRHEKYEYVELTEKGLKVASEVDRRHGILRSFLTDILKIDAMQAEEDACKMEHAISPATFEKLVQFIEFIEMCPRGGSEWLGYFEQYCGGGYRKEECLKHMSGFIEECINKLEKAKSIKEVKVMADRPLKDLSPGKKARITRVTGRGSIHRRLLDMGVVPGSTVEMERIAPLGDPIEVMIKGYHLSLRKEEAAHVFVEVS
ncbi:MAG: metal-dependent transcriptional regulator [Nitrospirota bacterium]